METRVPLTKLFVCQSVGFLAIIALSWLDEWLGLASLIFHDQPYLSDFRESALEMLLVLAVWFLVASATRRIVRHANHLKNFLRVCAWCRRIEYHGRWMPLEEFMSQGFDTPTTHGICVECRRNEFKIKAARARLPKPATNE